MLGVSPRRNEDLNFLVWDTRLVQFIQQDREGHIRCSNTILAWNEYCRRPLSARHVPQTLRTDGIGKGPADYCLSGFMGSKARWLDAGD
jgi:hypothetical protein